MIVVSGASGMVGSQIVLQFALSNQAVCGLYRRPSALIAVKESWRAQGYSDVYERVSWRQVDLLDAQDTYEALEGATMVIHAAAMVSFRKRDEAYMLHANPQMSENFWLAALDRQVSFGIHISSIATFSPDPRVDSIDETCESRRAMLSSYGKSKLDAELVAWRYHTEGLPLAVLYPSVVLGPSAWADGSSLFPKSIAKGLAFHPPGSTGWVDVRDVAMAVEHFLHQRPFGERFILNGANAPFKEVFSQLAQGLKVKPPRSNAPVWLLQLAWRLERLRERLTGSAPLLTKDSVRAAISHSQYSPLKANNAGWTSRPLEETTEWVVNMHNILHYSEPTL